MLQVKILNPKSRGLVRGRGEDAGYDIFPMESATVWANGRLLIPLGFATAFPAGWVALIHDRSSMRGLMKQAGVIDSGYRGEWMLQLFNSTTITVEITPERAVAQVILMKYEKPTVELVSELPASLRGTDGFGSTDARATGSRATP